MRMEVQKTQALKTFSKLSRYISLPMIVLCILGLIVSVELTNIHVFTHTDPDFHSICAVSESINCETVALSPYSVFAGLPVSVWGIMGYLAFGLLVTWGLFGPRRIPPWFFGGLIFLSSVFVCISIILQFISWTRIDSLCLFCTLSYVINLALFTLSFLAVRRARVDNNALLLSGIRCFLSNPPLAGTILLTIGVTVIVVESAVKPYWKSPGWDDLPKLARGIDDRNRHWIGAENPEVTIVEFSDYECPHCRKAHKKARLLAAQHPQKVRFIHRHLPLDKSCHPELKREFHKYACAFAEAAECAGEQGKFWEMNDALFSIQNTIKSRDVDVELLAVRLGLDRSPFKQCLESRQAASRVKKDLDTAMTKGLRATPTFIMGDKKYLGKIPSSELDRALNSKVKHAAIPRSENAR